MNEDQRPKLECRECLHFRTKKCPWSHTHMVLPTDDATNCDEFKPAFFNRDGKFIPTRLSEFLQTKYVFKTLIGSSGYERAVLWRYNENPGIYTPDGAALVEQEVQEALGDKFKQSRLREVLCHLKISTYIKPEDFEAPKNLIALENGVLDLETRELNDFSPDYNLKTKLPVKFDPEAQCPEIKQFLSDIQPDIETRATMQEFTGYCLLRDMPFHRAVMAVGPGANGKSTWLQLLTAFLGENNIASASLQELCYNRFAKAVLHQKLANLHADLSASALKFTGTFKMLTGGDRLKAEKKFRDPFEFVNYAKMVFSANQVPETEDLSNAFHRRWLIINFPNVFAENDPKTDKHILKKLTTPEELSGFLNYALEGLHRLLKQDKFTRSETVEQSRRHYIRLSDPIGSFADDVLLYDPRADPVAKSKVYRAFIEYCEKNKMPKSSQVKLSRNLPMHIPGIIADHALVGGKTRRVWRNIRIDESYKTEAVKDQRRLE